jgi:ParB family transcriptional regulator, chromosome partitioning protein
MEEKKVLTISLNDILPNRFQPRLRFNEVAINELAESIKKHGVIQPIVVRPIGDKFEIIAGERRYKASAIAGKNDIPAIVADLDDRNSAEVALIENVQREDLTPIEEAISYRKILDMGYLTQTELATKLGKEQSTVANKLRLLNLSEEVQDALLEEEISERHARSLLKLNKEQQTLLLKDILDKRLTVRKTDEEIEKILSNSNSIPNIKNDSSEIEVVDFGEMREEKMPIIEEVKNNNFEQIDINPGFVDIEKIESEAKDIFTDKPELDLNKVLNITEEKEEVVIEPRKFFSFLPEDQEEIVSVPKNEDIFKNFEFNDTLNKQQEVPTVELNNNVEEKSDYVPSFNIFEPSGASNPVIEETISFDNNVEEKPFTFELPNEKVEVVEEKPTFTPYYGDDLDEIQPIVNFEPKVESIKIEEPKNIRTAVNKTREFVKELEDLGFIIDIDELDFENNYQIILKINKE